MNIEFDLKDLEHLWHTGSTSVNDPGRLEYIRGDSGELPYQVWIGDNALQSLTIFKVLKAHGYKAAMYWDIAGSGSGDPWGHTIKTNYNFWELQHEKL